MAEVGLHVQADAVEGDPAPELHPDGGDLVLTHRGARRAALHPDAHAARPHLRADVEGQERPDHPGLQRLDEGAHVAPPGVEVQHDIGHPLPRPVIGELAAPGCLKHWEAVRLQEVGRLGRDPRRVERRMLQEPDQLRRPALGDGCGARLHEGDGRRIGDGPGRDRPLDGGAVAASEQRRVGP